MKRCRECEVEKALTEFYREAASPDGLRQICKACKNARIAKWRNQRRDYYNETMRAYNKKHYKRLRLQRYKLSEQEYDRMAETQNGGCAICGSKPRGIRPLAVDHDHATNKVRALLCYGCNRAIAVFDKPELFARAAAYIKSHRAPD